MRERFLKLLSEELYEQGYQHGQLEHAKQTSVRLYQMGFLPEDIACSVNASEDQVRAWLEEAGLLQNI